MASIDGPKDNGESRTLVNLRPTHCGVSLQQLQILNAVAFISAVALNGLAASGVLSEKKVGEVADMHPTKIKPAGGAFSIWSVIYTIEAFFVLYSFLERCIWPSSSSEDAILLHGVGFWFALACLFNALWIITFVQGNTASLWCSTVLIVGLLFSLCKMYLGAECWARHRPGGILQKCLKILALDIHFSMYAGWVTVACIVNISTALSSTGWGGEPFTETGWTVLLLCMALLLNSYIVITRKDCVWGFVLSWASYWIAVENDNDKTVQISSLVVCSLITVVSAVVTTRVLVVAGSRPPSSKAAVPVDAKNSPSGIGLMDHT